jgi:hypothetical protein
VRLDERGQVREKEVVCAAEESLELGVTSKLAFIVLLLERL